MPLVLVLVIVVLQGCVRADPPLPESPTAAPPTTLEPTEPPVGQIAGEGGEPGAAELGTDGETVGGQPAAAVTVGDVDEVSGGQTDGAPSAESSLQARYLACRERVEGPETDGECTSDAACAAQGCSGEVCAPAGSGLMTTCEVLPCYEVLQSCGCQAGRCQWTLGARPSSRDVPRPTRMAP
jgi:eight-cysteine-cluster-containing protein